SSKKETEKEKTSPKVESKDGSADDVEAKTEVVAQEDVLAQWQMALVQLENKNFQVLPTDEVSVEAQNAVEVLPEIVPILPKETPVLAKGEPVEQTPQATQEMSVTKNIAPEHLAQNNDKSLQSAVSDGPKAEQAGAYSEEAVAKTVNQVDSAQAKEESKVQKTGLENIQVVAQEEESKEQEPLFADLAQTPKTDIIQVKVGDAVLVNESNFAETIAEKVVVQMPQKENEFIIELMPKELGKVTIKLVMEAGRTLVSMTGDNPRTVSLLAENARSIGMLIENNTGTQTVVNVQEEKDMYQQQQDSNEKEQQQNRHNESQKEEKTEGTADFMQQVRLGLAQMEGWDRSILS
ncbi:MAG: flagellar hook-length control protein FliK, partial [Epulopiscium sp.]|nr:flagellar hook-length control protein FliK [Candidatus Epulonipiscium sp.]